MTVAGACNRFGIDKIGSSAFHRIVPLTRHTAEPENRSEALVNVSRHLKESRTVRPSESRLHPKPGVAFCVAWDNELVQL
jgi:hypothetical protein